MLSAISSTWKNNLVNDVHNKARFYANFRGIEYPAVSGTAAYSAETGGHYTSGTVNLSSGVMKYLVPLTQPMTIDCRIAYTNGADHDFITWHETENDYTKRLKVLSVSGGNIVCDWNESSSQIVSCTAGIAVFSPGDTLYPSDSLYPADITTVEYRRLTFVFNNGTSYLYINGMLCASGSTAAIATNKNWLDIDATGQIVDYIKIIPSFAASDSDVKNNFEDVYNEEIFFPYNNQSTGFTRCQITKYVNGYNIDLPGEFKSTQVGLSLNNISGELSADQYAAFSPENGSYNGTDAQSYLSRKIPIWIESWQDNKIQDIPDSVAGYWSMDDAPEIPDNPAGTTARWSDFTSIPSGWTVNAGAPVSTFVSGIWKIVCNILYSGYARVSTSGTVRVLARVTSGTMYLGYSGSFQSVSVSDGWVLVDKYSSSPASFVIYGTAGATLEIKEIYIGDGSYSTPLLDNSGNGRHGTIYGATPVDGVSGKALSFDGVNDYVSAVTASNQAIISCSAWIKKSIAGISGLIAAKDTSSLTGSWGFFISGSTLIFRSERITTSGRWTGPISDNTAWHHVAVTYDSSSTANDPKFYVDGVLVSTTETAIPVGSVKDDSAILQYIGAYPDGQRWAGTIDEPLIFYRVISAQEVLDLYNMRINRYNDAQEPSFETIFTGNISANSFARSTNVGDFSRISVQADSIIADIAKRIFRTGRKFEDYYLARTTDTGTSLFHELVKLGTQKEVYNYATNASFENATIGNSWAGTISRNNTHAFVGTYGGYINSATTVKTTVVTELTKYERFTFSVWAYSTSAINVTMQIRDMLATTPNGTTTSVNAHTGKGWQLLYVTHDVASSSSDRLECSIITTGTPALWLDAACLNYGDYKPMIAANTNDGTSAVSTRADGVLTAYQICGAIGENVSYQHPWAIFAKDENAWEKLKQLSEASLARHLYATPDGIIKLVTAVTAPASSIATISNIAGISASTQGEQANKLKVSGVKITEKTDMRIWNLNDSNSLTGDTGATSGSFQRTTGTGDYFPLLTEAPDGLECVYDKDVIEE